jgi:hypothetical protein
MQRNDCGTSNRVEPQRGPSDDGVAQSRMRSVAHDNDASFTASLGHGGNAGQTRAKYEGTTRRSGGRSKWTGQVNLDHQSLQKPHEWKTPRRIFVNSMSDLFHEDIPLDFLAQIFQVMPGGLTICVGQALSDPYGWTNRTMLAAHLYVTGHFDELTDGDVVDVEFVLGESTAPKLSERVTVPE